jgi:hypothetical protein
MTKEVPTEEVIEVINTLYKLLYKHQIPRWTSAEIDVEIALDMLNNLVDKYNDVVAKDPSNGVLNLYEARDGKIYEIVNEANQLLVQLDIIKNEIWH